MALGAPNIATPRPEDWRAWQTAISNTRQRIEILESQLGTLTTTQQQTSTTSSTNLNAILAQLAALKAEVTALEGLGADGADLTIAQRVFQRHPGSATDARAAGDSADLTIAQRVFQFHQSAPVAGTSSSINVDDASLTIAQQVLQRHMPATPLPPAPNDSLSILATQIFGA